MIRKILVLIMLISFVSPTAVQGVTDHWAIKEFGDIEACEVGVADYDSPASLVLQERLFRETGIPLQPADSLARYQLLAVLVEELQLPALEEQELTDVLKYYIDTCEY